MGQKASTDREFTPDAKPPKNEKVLSLEKPKASTVREFNPDTKPPKKENDLSLEKPKNENKDNEINARESLKTIQKRLGVNVLAKDLEMPMETESFIIDAIVLEKLKFSGKFNEIARAIHEKLKNQYGGRWSVLIAKLPKSPESSYRVTYVQGCYIDLTYDGHIYTVFKTN